MGDAGILVVAATPIGSPGDASPRLRDELATADVIAAEDTRRLRRLVSMLGISPAGRIVSFYEAVEKSRIPALLAELEAGHRVLLVSDAGMPGVSDPGYRLVRAAIDAGLGVTAVPGPSAVLTALAISGLTMDRFCFEGFPPRRAGERATSLARLAAETRTMVFFESPRRLPDTLAAMAVAFGPQRQAAVCRELTKTHEECRRGSLVDLVGWAGDGVLGEVTLVVAGADPAEAVVDPTAWAERVAVLVADGVDRKEALSRVAVAVGVPKRDVYDAVLAARAATKGSPPPPGS